MQEQNPYSAPQSNLEITQLKTTKKTIEEALNGSYNFSIGDIISKAWAAVNGFKMPMFLVSLLSGIVTIPFSVISGLVPDTLGILMELISYAVTVVFMATAYILALKKLRNQQVDLSNGIQAAFALALPLFLAALISTIISGIGILLLVLPGIYLFVAYSLTSLVIVDNPDISFWQAMETSRKLVTKRWFKVFALYLVLGLIMFVSIIPLGIGLIWTAPLMYLTHTVLYRTIFNDQ